MSQLVQKWTQLVEHQLHDATKTESLPPISWQARSQTKTEAYDNEGSQAGAKDLEPDIEGNVLDEVILDPVSLEVRMSLCARKCESSHRRS